MRQDKSCETLLLFTDEYNSPSVRQAMQDICRCSILYNSSSSSQRRRSSRLNFFALVVYTIIVSSTNRCIKELLAVDASYLRPRVLPSRRLSSKMSLSPVRAHIKQAVNVRDDGPPQIVLDLHLGQLCREVQHLLVCQVAHGGGGVDIEAGHYALRNRGADAVEGFQSALWKRVSTEDRAMAKDGVLKTDLDKLALWKIDSEDKDLNSLAEGLQCDTALSRTMLPLFIRIRRRMPEWQLSRLETSSKYGRYQ